MSQRFVVRDPFLLYKDHPVCADDHEDLINSKFSVKERNKRAFENVAFSFDESKICGSRLFSFV